MILRVTYDELDRVAQLLDDLATDCKASSDGMDVMSVGRARVLLEARCYETAASRLRTIVLGKE